jgi:hypothetical protein
MNQQPLKIVKLSTVMDLLKEKLGDGNYVISLEPDKRTEEALAAGKGDELWSLRTRVAETGDTVGDIGRGDQKYFAVRFVFHASFNIWQPLIDEEPTNPIGSAGYRMIGATIVPVTNLGGHDFLLAEQVSDPLGLGWMSLPAASVSNVRKVLQQGDKRVPGTVCLNPNRVFGTGGVESYVRWVPPEQIKSGTGLVSVRSFIDNCRDNRVLGAVAKAFEVGPLRQEYRPKA